MFPPLIKAAPFSSCADQIVHDWSLVEQTIDRFNAHYIDMQSELFLKNNQMGDTGDLPLSLIVKQGNLPCNSSDEKFAKEGLKSVCRYLATEKYPFNSFLQYHYVRILKSSWMIVDFFLRARGMHAQAESESFRSVLKKKLCEKNWTQSRPFEIYQDQIDHLFCVLIKIERESFVQRGLKIFQLHLPNSLSRDMLERINLEYRMKLSESAEKIWGPESRNFFHRVKYLCRDQDVSLSYFQIWRQTI